MNDQEVKSRDSEGRLHQSKSAQRFSVLSLWQEPLPCLCSSGRVGPGIFITSS